MTPKSKRGGYRKGAGRKSKAEKILLAGFNADWFTPEMQKSKWVDFLTHPDAKIRLDACKYLANRLYGMPTQAVDNKHSGELELIKRIITR